MLFGQHLHQELDRDFKYQYIHYDDLKAALERPFESEPTPENPHPKIRWEPHDEKRFIAQLDAELDRVFTFQRTKYQEIVKRVESSEEEVKDVLKRLEDYGTEDKDHLAEDFELLEQDLSDIIADVHDLAKYTRLNYTGFYKIIKKHDKLTHEVLKPAFAVRLRTKPFFADNYDNLIIRLSNLYEIVRTRGHPLVGNSAAGASQQSFVRQTTKYWVHPDDIAEVKLIILQHLPVLVHNAAKEFEYKDLAVTSIYYDNTDTWELYEGRLKKTEGAEAIRIRWYGGTDNKNVFVERKTHREDWTGAKSVKERFMMKEKHVNAFMSGEMTVEEIFQKQHSEAKSKEEEKKVADLERLAREIQYTALTRNYVPVTRSYYNRMAFQLPEDQRVRISLDTDLTMVREDNLDGRDRAGKNWRRTDIGVDYPFRQLPPEDVERFPYAVLEVKLQTQVGQESPEWILELIRSHLVEAVPKFSKYIHGTAKLNPSRIFLLPYWMPQMDIDIRKEPPPFPKIGIQRSRNIDISDDDSDDEDDEDEPNESDPRLNDEQMRRLHESRDARQAYDRERNTNSPGNELDEEERVAAMPLTAEESGQVLYDSEDEDDDLDSAKRIGAWYYCRKLIKHHVKLAGQNLIKWLKLVTPTPHPSPIPRDTQGTGPLFPNNDIQESMKRFKAPKGKRIHVPVRVEPKVYFAAERTFLAWLEFNIILGSIAAALLNFSGERTSDSKIPSHKHTSHSVPLAFASSLCFTILACLSLIYSLAIYLYRSKAIRERRAARYYDKWGPTVLCLGLAAAVGISFGVRVTGGGGGDLRGFALDVKVPVVRNGSC